MAMKKLRWAMEGDFWEVDLSTPATLHGVARPAGGEHPLPLGLSRGARLSRPKQIDFLQRFMAAPLVPSFSGGVGLSLQRLISLPLPLPSFARDACFTTLLGQFNVQKFAASLKGSGKSVWKQFSDPQFYALNFCWEWLISPQDTLVLSSEAQADRHKPSRKKAILHHKFPNHNLTLEASSPALFVDDAGNYWDVPFTLAVDLASLAPDSGITSHFRINHNEGSPRQLQPDPLATPIPPPTLLPGLSAKSAISFNKKFEIWKSDAPKARMVQPYDLLLSNPHVSASAVLGSVMTASLGENSNRQENESFRLCAKGANYAASADLFASASLSAQLGNFQKLFLDLTRFRARVDIPSGSKFLNGACKVAQALYNSQAPSVEAVQALTPSATISFQQQIVGPFSLRIDSGVMVDPKKEWCLNANDPVFAVEYALHVLVSAKAVAWYSPKQREFMIELRFFET